MLPARPGARGVPAAVALGLAAALATGAPSAAQPPEDQPDPPRRPDVVVILTDDQRADTLSRMPRVQRLLVGKGTSYVRAQVPTPLCCPSRASLLTGRYAHYTGVYSNGRPHGGWWAFNRSGRERRTIARALHRDGYRTGLFGKYFNSYAKWSDPAHRPPGWDEFLAFRTPVKSGAYYRYRLSDGRFRGTGARAYSTDVLARAAERFVRTTRSRRPLFALFAPYAPHAPWRPAPRHRGDLRNELPRYRPPSATEHVADKPAWVRRLAAPSARRVDAARQRQQESLLAVDEAVARLVDALADAGRLDNTLLVYASDNGLLLGEHGIIGKGAPYAEALSVPLVLRWDGRVPAGRVDDRLALNLDITTTIAHAASVRFATDGQSLLGKRGRTGFVVEGTSDLKLARPAYCGWRSASWTYVRWATGEEELYSQEDDPYQLRNLAGDGRWQPVLAGLRERARRACTPEPPEFDW